MSRADDYSDADLLRILDWRVARPDRPALTYADIAARLGRTRGSVSETVACLERDYAASERAGR